LGPNEEDAMSMHAVVNHLPIRPDADWGEITAKAGSFFTGTKAAYPKLRSAVLIRVGAGEAIFVGVYDDRSTMEYVSSEVAGPWFAEHIRPYLSGPVARSTGEVVAGFA
jgi:hypothetical protein